MLGKSVIVKGQIFSREDLTIDGEVEGTVELQEHRLTVGPNGQGHAPASRRARSWCWAPSTATSKPRDKIDIRKEAKLVGDIKTARIVIEDGAYFKGNIDIVRAEAPRPAAATGAQAASSVARRPRPTAPAMAAGAGDNKR